MSEVYKATRQDIYNGIWTLTLTRFARKNNISYNNLKAACENHSIPVPTAKYWRDLKNGKPQEPPPLLPPESEFVEIPFIRFKKNYFDLTSKANTICILKILERYSDEKKPISAGRIIELMEHDYELPISRVTVYDSIEILNKLGYDISTYDDNKQGYYIRNREFDAYEIQIIQDSLAMNPFLPEKMELEIRHKFDKKLSIPNHINFRIIRGINKRNKAYQRFYYNLEQIDCAKINNKMLTFEYGSLDISGNVITETVKTYTMTPERIVAENNNYYLRCISQDREELIYFRINKMYNPIVTDIPSEKRRPSDEFNKMYAIEEPEIMLPRKRMVELKCNMCLLEEAIDFFGNDITLKKNKDNSTFTILKRLDLNQTKIWCLRNLKDCEAIAPEELRNEITDAIKNNIYNI